MRLSEEKIERIAADLVELIEDREDLLEFKGDRDVLERDITRFLIRDFAIEDEIDEEAAARMKTYSRSLPDGSTQWEVKLRKHKEEIAARRGYVI